MTWHKMYVFTHTHTHALWGMSEYIQTYMACLETGLVWFFVSTSSFSFFYVHLLSILSFVSMYRLF